MKYDTTGPVTVNENISLLYLLGLLALVAAAAWLTLELQNIATHKSIVADASQPAIQPANQISGGVNRTNDNLTIVTAGDTVINIYQNDTNVWPSRSYSRDNPDAAERWRFASILEAIARDPTSAERYGAADVAEKIRGLNIRFPQLTATQRNTIRDLFLAAQDAKGDDRIKADQALRDAVAAMPVPVEEQKAFDYAIDKARALLTPAQLELIRTGGKREPTTTRAAK